jgi:hypothetical protein
MSFHCVISTPFFSFSLSLSLSLSYESEAVTKLVRNERGCEMKEKECMYDLGKYAVREPKTTEIFFKSRERETKIRGLCDNVNAVIVTIYHP